MRKIASADPSRMTGEQLKRRFSGGNFSLKRFIRDFSDEIPEQTLDLLRRNLDAFKAIEKMARNTDIGILRWLWGDGELSEDDQFEICLFGEQEFAEEAEAAKEHVLCMLTGQIAGMAFYNEAIEVLADDDDWLDELLENFLDKVLVCMNSNCSEIRREYDFELYNDFMTDMSREFVKMAPHVGFEVLCQLTTDTGEVYTKSCREFDKDREDWFSYALEFNSVPELIRSLISDFVENMDRILYKLDKNAIKEKLRDFAKHYADRSYDIAPVVASIAYAAL